MESCHEDKGSPIIFVAIPLFDRVTARDAIGPYKLLHVVLGVIILFGQEASQLFVANNGPCHHRQCHTP